MDDYEDHAGSLSIFYSEGLIMIKKIFFSLYTALFLVGVAASITGCNY